MSRERDAGPAIVWRWIRRLDAALLRPVPLVVPIALAAALVVAAVGFASVRRDADTYQATVAGLAGARAVALDEVGDVLGVRGTLVLPDTGDAYLVLRLPEPPAGRTWEAWVIRGERPLAAGITGRRSGVFTLVLSTPVVPGDQIALTLEVAGGVSAPTTKPILAGRV